MALEEATLANISFSDTKLKIRRGTAADADISFDWQAVI